jgi:hypothetical protein
MASLISWEELFRSSSEQRFTLLRNALGIDSEAAKRLIGSSVEAGCLILESGLEMGLSKREALEQISTINIAAVIDPDWEKPQTAIKNSNHELHARYSGEKVSSRKQFGIDFPLIHFLRKESFERVVGKSFIANAILTKRYWDVRASNQDFKRGSIIPYPVDEMGLFIMGVYYTISSTNGKNQFILHSDKKRKDFIEKIMVPSVMRYFNAVIPIRNSERFYENRPSGKSYTSKILDIRVTSKMHRDFVERYFRFRRDLGGLADHYLLPSLLDKRNYYNLRLAEREDERHSFFLFGALNARGSIQYENDTAIMIMIDKNESYLDIIQEVAENVGYRPSLKRRGKSDTYQLRFSRKEVDRMREETLCDRLFDRYPDIFRERMGIFVNPHQIQRIRTVYKS